MTVTQRVADIRGRVDAAVRQAGRSADSVTLVAVCKRQPFDRIWEAYQAGLRDFGENTAQGMNATADGFDERGAQVRWHFVGGLQRNKVNTVLGRAPLLHSVDRLSLAEAISKRSQSAAEIPRFSPMV